MGLLLHYTLVLTIAVDQQRAKPAMCGLCGQTGMSVDIKLQSSAINTSNHRVQATSLGFIISLKL